VSQVLRVAWYRLHATFGRRWAGYLTLVLLVGLLGGLAMGTLAAARRTQSSFSAFLASTNPSDVALGTALLAPGGGVSSGYDPALIHTIAHLPHVRAVASVAAFNSGPLEPNGTPQPAFANASNVNTEGSVDGRYFTQDRVTVTQGRMANPNRADEIVMPIKLARQFGFRVGQVIPWGIYSNAQVGLSNFVPGPGTQPYLRVNARLVGIVVFNNTVVQDEADVNFAAQNVLFTPALTRQLTQCCLIYTFTGLQLEHGAQDVTAVEAELVRVVPPSLPHDFTVTAILAGKADRTIKPEAIALGVFGGIAALAALVIAGQVIGRQLRLGADEASTLRALGADPAMTLVDGLIGMVVAVVVGSLLAVAVAVAMSPLAPLGPVRPLYPTPGFAFDWTVLGLGLVALIVGLSAIAAGLAARGAPHRAALHDAPARTRRSSLAHAASRAGLPPSVVAGIRLALEPGGGRNAVPVRSAILGAAMAMVVVVATLGFGASLNTLVSHPALYGWNWSYALNGGGGIGAIPQPQAANLLHRDHTVAASADVYFASMQVDNQTVSVLGTSPNAPVAPPLLSGHGFDAPNQVVLGATTLQQIHKHLGDTVAVRYGTIPPTRLTVVGTATMPAIGIVGVAQQHTMGTGAVLSYRLIPPSVRNSFQNTPDGPNAILVRLRDNANPRTSLQALNRIAAKLTLPTNYGVGVVSVQRPAEIVNYRSMGTTPAILGGGLGAGAIAALGLTLIASVRRRRYELAILKTLGFTRRQLAATVAGQSTVAVAIGSVIGAPLGVILGRTLWNVFARQINAVAAPTVPVVVVALVVVGALILANVVAAIPGQIAARTPTAGLLQAE
jgi:hypothetical protein